MTKQAETTMSHKLMPSHTAATGHTGTQTHGKRRGLFHRLLKNTSGIAMVEFAYSLPFVLLIAMGGMEVANYALTHMRVSQISVSLADNASRAKEQVISGIPQMREVDVNESFAAAELQAGSLNLPDDGRLILSSLEVNPDGGQWIHWQRCFGGGDFVSSFGSQGDGSSGMGFPGMGPPGKMVTAEPGFAIMFAEVAIQYKPLFTASFLPETPIRKHAAMYVRDERDLSNIYNPSPAVSVNKCN